MTDSKQLHTEAAKLRNKMQICLGNADKANIKADLYTRSGDYDRSSFASDQANRYYKEALELEHAAIECDNKAAALEAKACEIEKQETELQMHISELEKIKKSLRGDK